MKPKNTIATTIFYLSICILTGVGLIVGGVIFLTGSEAQGVSVLLFCVGALFVAMGIYGIVSTIKGRANRGSLSACGQKCSGVIVKIEPDYSTTLNGRHPEIAVCHVVDSYTGEPFEVRSTGYMSDLSQYLMKEVDVYIDRYDRTKYFVDIEKLAGVAPYVPENNQGSNAL